MTSQARRAGAEFLRTIAQALDPGGESERSLLYAKDVQGTPQFFAKDPNFAHQVSGTECNFWSRPLTASAYDDEFDSIILDPSWTQGGTWSAVEGGLDPYAGFSLPDGAEWALHTNYRQSWLAVQPPSDETSTLDKAINFAGDFFVYARFSTTLRSAAISDNEASCYLALSSDPWDANNQVYVKIGPSGATNNSARFARVVGGVFTQIGITSNMFSVSTGLQAIEAVGITRRGTTFDGWAFGASGGSIWLGSTIVAAVAATRAQLGFQTTVTTNPGNKIVAVDFIRFREGSTWLP